MLYHGQIRQVGSVEDVRRTHDPVVRQFLDGRPEAVAEADTGTFRAVR
jgi:ABC-type transporter Mla maintaining outer membrane lipid asymmetry ATPase subunit MlaF